MVPPHQPGAPALVVLAAGIGHRFGSPKQLAPVGPKGEAILDYTVRDARAAGFDVIVLVVRSEIEVSLSEHVKAHWPGDVAASLRYSVQDREPWSVVAATTGRRKPLGTAHAVVTAANDAQLNGPFAVVNADDLYGADAFALLRAGLIGAQPGAQPTGVLVAYEVAKTVLGTRPVTRALCEVDGDGRLVAIREGTVDPAPEGLNWTPRSGGERRPLHGHELVSMNCWGFGTGVVDRLRRAVDRFVNEPANLAGPAEILLPEVAGCLLAAGDLAIDVRPAPGRCLGLTHPEDLALVRAALSGPAW